jgi:enamine deaminase RidA (YjgF/YER057c/UK114 family)
VRNHVHSAMSERVIRRVINTSKAPRPIGPYRSVNARVQLAAIYMSVHACSHAISVGSTVYVSGQTGVDPQVHNFHSIVCVCVCHGVCFL